MNLSNFGLRNYKILYSVLPGMKVSFLAILFSLTFLSTLSAKSQSISRDLNIGIAINQVGYQSTAAKKCVLLEEVENKSFKIIKLNNGNCVFEGKFDEAGSAFGEYGVGDFSSIQTPGTYYIKADSVRSYPFKIKRNIYQQPLESTLNYFQVQRCGRSTSGYLSPCHLDDGVRMDNGKHIDATGGWHDANDLRKEVAGTIYGMIGLTKYYEIAADNQVESQILDELRWGNKYFLAMQEPEGYVMKGIGPHVIEHADNNRWTDNQIGEEKGELHLVKPSGTSTDKAAIVGNKDDRVINTDPVNDVIQFNFIYSEAKIAELLEHRNSEYAEKCLQAALDCMDWANEENIADNVGEYGAFIRAAVQLFQITGDKKYKNKAIEYGSKIVELQVNNYINDKNTIRGFFKTSSKNDKPYVEGWRGNLPYLALCTLVEKFPEHKNTGEWKAALKMYSTEYLQPLAKKNAFGLVPYGLFKEKVGGGKKVGDYWYRFFSKYEEVTDEWMGPGKKNWRVMAQFQGSNSHILSTGIGLVKSGKILNNDELKSLGQRQLDWVWGMNPQNVSAMEGFGNDIIERFINDDEFRPATPRIEGGVMNGIAGNKEDQPISPDKAWQTAEYWIPHVGHMMWLLSEL